MSSGYRFARTDETRRFCARVEEALVTFCGYDVGTARELILSFWQKYDDIADDELLFREPPYYYAMCIAHHAVLGDNQPLWYLDRRLWPPPPGWQFE